MSESTKHRNKRILIAAVSAVSAAAIIVPIGGALLAPYLNRQDDAPSTPTTTKPALTIKPLPVRPVISAFVTTPAQCPAPPKAPVAPDKPIRICDIPKTAVYELGPQALTLQLVNADSIRNPLTGVEIVQMTMTRDSAQDFSKYTAGQVGKQVAFVRDGSVVWGPKIGGAIDGEVLQLSGELTAEQAKEIAKKLKDGT